MEEIDDIKKIISEINRITSATRVLQPEQAILRCITFFDVALRKTKRKSLNIEVINNSLRALLKVCDGKLSPQCSVSISRHICDFYKIQKSPPFEETVTEFLDHMTPASTIAIGDLCAEFGQRKIEIVLRSITSLKLQIARYENLYALHRIFKSYQSYNNAISKYAYQVYQLVVKNFFSFHLSCYIISFKLLRALVKNDLYLCPLSIGFSELILKQNNISQFVKNEAIKLAATAALCSNDSDAFKILLKINQICDSKTVSSNSNSGSSSQNSSNSLSNLSLFNSKSVVTKFFERLSPDQIISDHKNLFNFVRKTSPSSIFEIAPFLSRKVREEYFSKLLIERNPSPAQISIMKALQIDTCSTASLAYHLINSKNPQDQEYVVTFFRTIDRETQLLYLKNSFQHILTEKNQKEVIYGDYILARCLIERVGTDEQCIKECLKVLNERKMYQNPMFWHLMSFYDNSSKFGNTNSQIEQNSIGFHFVVQENMIESAFKVALSSSNALLIESLLLYFSKHPNDCWDKHIQTIMKYASSNLKLLTNRCILALIDLCVALRRKEKESNNNSQRLDDGTCNIFVPFFVQRFMKEPPNPHFYSTLVTKPMILFTDHLNLIPRSAQTKSASTTFISEKQQVSRKIALMFADLYDTISDDATKQTLVKNLAATVSIESHALLLQLVKSKKIKLNVDSFLPLLTGNDFLRVELTSEIISFLNPPIDKVYKFVKSFPTTSPIPFLFLSSIFCNSLIENPEVPSSDSYLNQFISLFDFSVLSTNLFSLHCLSALLISKSVEIIALEIGTNFLTTILSLVNCKAALQPLFLILICEVFVNILPLLSVNLIGNKEMCALVLSIVESVKGCTYESAKEMYYQISTACLAYAPQFAFSYFNFFFKFPSRSSRKVRMASFDAISQSLNLTTNTSSNYNKNSISNVNYALNANLVASYETYVNGLKDIFVFLQQTNDDRIKECINLICSYKLPALPSPSLLQSDYGRSFDFGLIELQFISIAKSVFIRNSLPGFADVEPSQKVKETALFCVEQIKNARDKLVCISKSLEMGITVPAFSLLTRTLQASQEVRPNMNSICEFKNELFNIAKYAFSINLRITKPFLTLLLNEETLDDFFALLANNCGQRSTEFFELATNCCLLASQNERERQNELKFARFISPLLREIIENLMIHQNQASSKGNAENIELISSMKSLNAFLFSFYPRIYSSFIWSENVCSVILIQNDSLFAFLVIEMMTTDEFWRIQSAINGLSYIVKYFSNSTSGIVALIDEALQAILRLSRKQQLLLSHEIYEFVHMIIRMHNNISNNDDEEVSKKLTKSSFDKILYLSRFIEFDCEIISTLLNVNNQIDNNELDFVRCCRLKDGESDEKKLALFRVAIEKDTIPNQLISDFSSSPDNKEKQEFYRYCVKSNFNFNHDNSDPNSNSNEVEHLKENVLKYVNENIDNDNGRSIINEAIRNKSDSILPQLINILLHNFKEEKDALLLSLFVERFGDNQKIAESISRFALSAVNDNVKNIMIVLRSLLKVNKAATLKIWKDIGDEKQKQILNSIESKL